VLLNTLYCRFSYDCNSLSKNEITRSLGGITIIGDFLISVGISFLCKVRSLLFPYLKFLPFQIHPHLTCFSWAGSYIMIVMLLFSKFWEETNLSVMKTKYFMASLRKNYDLSQIKHNFLQALHIFLLFANSISVSVICSKAVVYVVFLLWRLLKYRSDWGLWTEVSHICSHLAV